MTAKKLRIVVADDSVVVRQLLVDVINAQPDMEVVACVSDGLRAVIEFADKPTTPTPVNWT